jgi:HAD superfamily hydrolase (TIGR01450 family)
MRHAALKNAKYFVLDMDGTFYLGERMVPGAGDFARSLKTRGLEYRFFTNNSSNSAALCRDRLRGMGFAASPDEIILSSDVAADYLNARCPGAGVYLLGNERLTADLRRAGVRLVDEKPDLVLLGFDTTLDYGKITKAANWIAAGLPYSATHPDVTCPGTGGFLPDTGAMIALFEASAKRRPIVFGKPERFTVDYLRKRLRCRPEQLVFVGDRLETDIAIGARHGIPSVLVLTGVTTREIYEAQSEVRASLVVESIADLAGHL